MNKRYRLGEIEEAVSEMEELIDTQDDIAEIDDDFQIVVSGWSVYVERLKIEQLWCELIIPENNDNSEV